MARGQRKVGGTRRPELRSLSAQKDLRYVKPRPVLSSAKVKAIVTQFGQPPSTVSAPLVLSAQHTYEVQGMGAFIAASDVDYLNAGFPIIEFPLASAGDTSPTGRLTVNLLNQPKTGYALQYRVFNDVFPLSPGKYRIDAYVDDLFTPSQHYELDMQPNHQTFGFYLPPPTSNLLWMSLDLYPVWATSGDWSLYDITINKITF